MRLLAALLPALLIGALFWGAWSTPINSIGPEDAGKTVIVSGTYRGWAPLIRRSDWRINDRTGTIVVSGQTRFQPPQDLGRPVRVWGTVRVYRGQPYIEARWVW